VSSYRVALTASTEKEAASAASESGCPHSAASRTSGLGSRPPGCKKLKGGDKEWRIRVGDYRIVYVIDDTARTVDVTRIAHRREVYE
jgi:mRNA interferase RelE/StbE